MGLRTQEKEMATMNHNRIRYSQNICQSALVGTSQKWGESVSYISFPQLYAMCAFSAVHLGVA